MLKRRDFLGATLVTVGALVAPACGDETESGGLTTTSTGTGGGTTTGSGCEPTPGEQYFPQSIASGDPRPDSVIVWTRVIDPDHEGDLDIELEVAEDEGFEQLVEVDGKARVELTAEAAFDHCVKARLVGLSPATTYYYRFLYTTADGCFASRTGRTKTAPTPDADVPVKFAYVSCQDFIGKYYNNYLRLAQEELDFFVHLGDYVYETTGDPTFQDEAGDRIVKLGDVDGAIALQSGEGKTYYAAKSLDNYRDLYRTYRSDAALQAVHEKLPMIATWDDHEFSDDCHGATASYFDDLEDETDEARRKNANKAWFEYMPVDYAGDPEFRYDESAPYPDDIRIYRDFAFGKHLHLVMTDLRSYRADHVIPEGAFPGLVILDQAQLEALGDVPDFAQPYVDIDAYKDGAYQSALVEMAEPLGYAAENVKGNLSVSFVNEIVEAFNEGKDPQDQISTIDPASIPERGIAYTDLGKRSYNSSIGSRYLVVKDTFDVVGTAGYASSKGATETVMGGDQEAWFLETMKGSKNTWKVWGNEYCLVQLGIDLTKQAVPPPFQNRYYMNVDAWDGFRNRRSELIEELAGVGNVVAITGDVHAFYAGTPTANGDPGKKIVELVTSSISSATFKSLLEKQVKADPLLSKIPTAGLLAGAIDSLLGDTESKMNPHLAYANSGSQGFVVVEVSAEELVATYHVIAEKEAFTDYSGKEDELAKKYETVRFRALAGDSELYTDDGGTWKRWDPDSMSWV